MRICLSLTLILFIHSLFAQEAKQYSFKHFSVINGLASNTAWAVTQDKDGYIWIATGNGLQRYDGSAFITFKSQANDPTSIPSNFIVNMFVDRKKNLWLIGDNNKVGIFDTRKFSFKDVPMPIEKRKFYIPQSFLETPTGEFFVVKSDRPPLRYLENKNQFVEDQDFFPSPPKWKRSAIVWDNYSKKYWFTCDSGLVQYDPASGHLNYRGHNIDNDPVIKDFGSLGNLSAVYVDQKGDVIFSHWPALAGGPTICKYNRKLDKAEFLSVGYPGYHEIAGWFQQRNGRLWMFGLPYFAEWVDDSSKPFRFIPNVYRHEQSLKFDYPLYVYEDKESNIWIATDNGMFVFNPDRQTFTTYNVTESNGKVVPEAAVQAMQEMDDGNIFVGCWSSPTLTYYDNKFNPLPLPSVFPKGIPSIWDMAVNPKSKDLWITLQGGGLIVYNQKKNSYKKVYPDIFEASTIRQVDEDTSGNLWFGTQNGLVVKWDYKKSGNDPTKGYELVLRSVRVLKVHYDYQGYIWVATLGNGLLKIDARTRKLVRTFTSSGKEDERLFLDSPGDMTYYDDTTLIVVAGCVNILNTRTNKISYITTEDGLPSNTTMSVEKDKDGIIWLGMTNGLCRLNLQKKLITYYDRRDGIVYDKFALAGIKELDDGRLIYYTDHNFLSFDPTGFGQQRKPAKPVITSFKLAGHALSLDSMQQLKRIALKYNNTSIAINFSGLSFLPQQKVHYYYMLENLDKNWIRTDGPIEVIYNYLPPGNYIFKVKSENADGISSGEIATLPILVRAPVWKTWWFYSLIALLIVAVLYLLDRERMNKRRSLLQMRNQIGHNLHDEVSTALSNINVLSEIAKIKADKNIEQSKDFIDQISDKSRQMMEAMDDMLWSIDPENDSMKKTILRIKEITEGMRIANNIEIDLLVDNKVEALELDMKLRHEVFFYYKEALNFVVHHVRCNQLFVNFKKLRSRLLIEILSECNNVEDFSPAFRKSVEKRLKNLSATLDVAADSKSFCAAIYVDLK